MSITRNTPEIRPPVPASDRGTGGEGEPGRAPTRDPCELDPSLPGIYVQEDYTAFYRREFAAVAGLAYVLCGNRGAAEELAQDAFAAAFRQWDRIGHYDNPGAWVRRAVSNRSVSWHRRLRAEGRALVRIANRRGPVVEMPDDASQFWAAVRGLPPRQAQVVALYYGEDRTTAEIGDILGIGAGTVKAHLHQARHTLLTRLAPPP